MPRIGLALALLALAAPAPAAAPPARPLWLAVVAPDFADAITPLVEHRQAQGFAVAVLKTTDVLTKRHLAEGDAGKLRDRVRSSRATHVLLVGAVDSIFPARVVPPCRGTVGRMKGEPTDAGYSSATVAVGRFPARDVDEVRAMVGKTLALEKAGRAAGPWKRRITVLAGIPAYNPLVDRLIEGMAMSRFDRIHANWSGRAIYTNPSSRFCLPPKELRTKALAYLGEGQAFTLYLGHSNAQTLYGGEGVRFLERGDWGKVKMPHGGGVFVTFGCNGCQLGGEDGEGYGLWAMRNPDGPAAVIGSHGVCFAAMVNLAADGLFRSAFQGEAPERLAPAWLALHDGVRNGRIDFLSYRALDAVDGDSRIPQATQRREHVEMFVLLGDPALRLPRRERISLTVPELVAGQTVKVSGELPEGMTEARVTVSVERTPGGPPTGLVALPAKQGEARYKALRTNFEKANAFSIVSATVTAKDGRFTAELKLPADLPTACVVRARAAAKGRDAAGAQRVTARPDR